MYGLARSYITKVISSFLGEEWNPALPKILSHPQSNKGHISHFYKFTHTPLDYSSSQVAMTAWTKDIPGMFQERILTGDPPITMA